MDEQQVLEQVRGVLAEAMESRRGLVAFSRLDAIEMDRRAREVERDALHQARALLPEIIGNPQLHQVKTRLVRMDEQLEDLAGRPEIQERSRGLERDDITWRTFEDIAWLLGVG